MDVEIRGIVQPMHGRAGMVLSHARQFHGGPPKFRPNPLLARGFDAEQERPPVNDPNLRRPGRTSRLYEHQGSGDAAGEVVPVTPMPEAPSAMQNTPEQPLLRAAIACFNVLLGNSL